MKTCYMCEKDAVSGKGEHVPPKCLFPEQKDLSKNVDLRKNLITVPACAEHNTSKSKDDEYLLYLLVINLPANEVAKNQFATKIMRDFHRNPKLIQHITRNPFPVMAVDSMSGETHNTFAVQIDESRLNSALDHIARALYFHHLREKWLGNVTIRPDFILWSIDKNTRELNEPVEKIAEASDMLFLDSTYFGENPDIFKHQVTDGNEKIKKLMRLYFYNGCRVSVLFGQYDRKIIEKDKRKV